jgi:hypothetical protein
MRRQDDLRAMESAHIREMMAGNVEHSRQLREAESARIDAIRAVDVGAVQRAAEVQAAQQQALAAQVVATADAFRSSLAAALGPITTAIDDLRRAQYETQGQKQQVVETRDTGSVTRLNIGTIVAVVSVVIAFASLLLYVTKK